MPESLFNKVAGLRPVTLLNKRFWHRCFPRNFVKFLRNTFLHKTPLVAGSVSSESKLAMPQLEKCTRCTSTSVTHFQLKKNLHPL